MHDASKTLSYYDVLDMPVQQPDGSFEYLFDREYLVPLYKERQRIAKSKWRIARRVAWWMRFVPFVRVVFASGSLSMNNTDELSDLDVVIVAKYGHIWTVRLLLMGLLIVLGKARRHEDNIAPDKICPNHFITDQSLHVPFHSMYTAQLYSHLIPLVVIDIDDLQKFRTSNQWVLDFTPTWNMPEDRIVRQGLSFMVQWFCELAIGLLGEKLERSAKRYQKHRIETKANIIKPGGHLVYNDSMLAFHLGSSEAEILKKYENNKSKLINGLL